ncbi:MAG: DUF2330 domain-containing protein, partial [Myxococcales bacterium]|nr:DUF2330 domain-containing protein [Myxococcales bacterium]
SMSNNYKGPTEDFAMVVPVPVVLQKAQVKTLPADVFDKIDALSAPRLVEYWERDPCQPPMPQKSMAVPGMVLRSAGGGGMADKDFGVKVEARFSVGEYTIVILSAKEATGLDRWLRANQYKIPAGADAALAPYIQEGMKFFVAKVDIEKVKRDAEGTVVLSPLRFDFESPDLRLPVRLGLLNANGKQDLIVYTLHPSSRFEVANYPNVFIPTNIEVLDEVRERFGSFYTALFDKTLTLSDGKAIVTEYSWQAGSCDPCPVPPLQDNDLFTLGGDVLIGGSRLSDKALQPQPRPSGPFFGSGSSWVLTRMHTRYSKDTLSEDLVFKPAEPVVGGRARWDGTSMENPGEVKPDGQNNFQGRYIIRHYWEGPVACDNPQWDIWGGPDGESSTGKKASAATGLGSAKRTPMALEKIVRSKLDSHGLPGLPKPGQGERKQ